MRGRARRPGPRRRAPGNPSLPGGARHVADPRRGQGAAVQAALDAAAAAALPAPFLVVNADLPCATTRDLLALAGAVPDGGLALVEAADGTTNALGLADEHALPAGLRPGQRGALRRARSVPAARRSEPHRRRRHDRRPRAAAGTARRAHAARARVASPRVRCVKVAVLSGGVGGARFLRGVLAVVEPADVSIVGNVADDLEVLGLHVSPDLDSILYALAGRSDEQRGWGRADETWRALETVAELGGESWFRLGDRDLGLHLVRTRASADGSPAVRGDRPHRCRVRSRGSAASCLRRSGAHVPRDAGRHVRLPDVVRRPRARRRGRRSALRGRTRGVPGTRRARGARGRRRDRDRAEQPVRLDRADPRRRGDPRGARAPPRTLRRGEPADRRQGGQGPGRPHARTARRRHRARRTWPAATPA